MEVPEDLVKTKRPDEYILTTSRKGYLRFHTKEILNLVSALEKKEELLNEAVEKFITKIFVEFYKKSPIWTKYIDIVGDLDCLSTLAIISSSVLLNC